jgi:hypothetical protein
MSLRASTLAVRHALRDKAFNGPQFTPAQCEITIDGRPHAAAGELFVGIHAADWSNSGENHFDESFGVEVTVSLRHPKVPEDRVHLLLAEGPSSNTPGLWYWCERVRLCVHLNYASIMDKANAIINNTDLVSGSDNGFVEPLYFKSGGRATRRGPDWWSSPLGDPPLSGVSQTMTFTPAKRVQIIEEAS